MVKPLKKYEKPMKGVPIHYLNPQNCLEFEGNLNARSASAISSARIPSESYADFSL